MDNEPFARRIENGACPHIRLLDEEKRLLDRDGWAIITVRRGRIIAVDHAQQLTGYDWPRILRRALYDDNRWIGLASGPFFCDPKQIEFNNGDGVFRLLSILQKVDAETKTERPKAQYAPIPSPLRKRVQQQRGRNRYLS